MFQSTKQTGRTSTVAFLMRTTLGAVATLALTIGSVQQGQAAPPDLEAAVVSGSAPTSGTVMNVAEARKKAKDGETILVSGRIREFVNGVANFSLLDPSIKSCKENGENCATPWDLCGDQYTPKHISENSATVKVVGTGKAPIRADIKGVKGVDHLVPVTVEGKAQIDGEGNLTVRASKVYVKK